MWPKRNSNDELLDLVHNVQLVLQMAAVNSQREAPFS